MSVVDEDKKEYTAALLQEGDVYLQLDPRRVGVVVPERFRVDPVLVLQIGWNMPVPIPDMVLSNEGFRGTLSFDREPFFCLVPWDAVFGIVDIEGNGRVYPDCVPEEVSYQKGKEPTNRPKLGVIDGGRKEPLEKGSSRTTSHLRLVKK